jgi:hypothetical protein
MIMTLPSWLTDGVYRLGFARRPQLQAVEVDQAPAVSELMDGELYVEIRSGHLKWVHFRCPLCGEHIQLPMAGKERWRLSFDWLRRPTLMPSIWEEDTCGAHFFVRRGQILWCG